MDEHPCDEIDFYPGSVCCNSAEKFFAKTNEPLKKKIARFAFNFSKKIRFVHFVVTIFLLYFKKFPLSAEDKELLKKYDFVHVHGSYEILSTFLDYKSTKTKIILTTHTPEPLIDEEIGRFGVSFLFKIFPRLRIFF